MLFAQDRALGTDNGGGFTPPTYLQQRTPIQASPSQPKTEPTFSAPGAGTAQTGFRAPVDEGGGEVLPKDGQTPFPQQQSPQFTNPTAAPQESPPQQIAASGRNVYDSPPPPQPIAPPAQLAPPAQAAFTPQATLPQTLASAPQEGGFGFGPSVGFSPASAGGGAPPPGAGTPQGMMSNPALAAESAGPTGGSPPPSVPQAIAPQPGFGQLGQMILDKLKNPSQYDTSTMQNAIANNEAQLKTQEDAGLSGVDSDMAARGLLMGSPDVIDRSKIRNNIQQARGNFDTNITMDRAHTMAADNAQAYGNAFNFVGQGQQQQQLDNSQQFNWAQLAAELGNLNAPNPNSALGSMPMSQPNFGGIDPATMQAIGSLFAKQGGAAPAAGSGNQPVNGASIY